MAHGLSQGLVGTIVQVTPSPIRFADLGGEIEVAANDVTLDVSKHLVHDPNCGAMQWFHPFLIVTESAIGMTAQHAFTGSALGTKWSDSNRRSAFFRHLQLLTTGRALILPVLSGRRVSPQRPSLHGPIDRFLPTSAPGWRA